MGGVRADPQAFYLCKIAGVSPVWLVVYVVPCVGWILGIFVAVLIMNTLAASFGKGVGYTVGLVLLPPVFLAMLGYGDAEYDGPAGATVRR